MNVEPIGRVSSSRRDSTDDNWDAVSATITLDAGQFSPEALQGIAEFSHVEIVYVFDQVEPAEIEIWARHPRGNRQWPSVGIFAQRAKMRPNRLGVSVCRLLEVDGLTLTVEALDAMDGSPVLDVKPYMAEFGPRGAVHQPAWSHELMATYWSNTSSNSVTG
jgi:tRNA (adenine37-N6)-methyltransferase